MTYTIIWLKFWGCFFVVGEGVEYLNFEFFTPLREIVYVQLILAKDGVNVSLLINTSKIKEIVLKLSD